MASSSRLDYDIPNISSPCEMIISTYIKLSPITTVLLDVLIMRIILSFP